MAGEPCYVYVSTASPRDTETFVTEEMRALRERGLDVRYYGLRKPDPGIEPASPILRRAVGYLGLLPWLPWASLRMMWTPVPAPLKPLGRLRRLGARAFVLAHAMRLARAARSVEQEGRLVTLHAHFLARPAEVAVLAARLLGGRKVIVTVHASDAFVAPSEPPPPFFADVNLYRCDTNFASTTLTERWPGVPTTVVGSVTAPLPTMDDASRERFTVVTVARLVGSKGYDTMMATLTAVAATGTIVEWRIVGDGPLRAAIEAWAATPQRGLSVVLLGTLAHSESLAEVARADVFLLLPNRVNYDLRVEGDGLPVVLIEAALVGTPVVTSDSGATTELVRDGVTGFVVNPGDPQGAAQAVLEIARGGRRDHPVAAAARSSAWTTFGRDATAGRLDAVLRELGGAT